MTGKPIKPNDEVVLVENVILYVRKLGYLVSNLKFMLMLFIMLILMVNISAFEIDNIKEYDPELKKVTIKNAFGLGDEIASIYLNTPLFFEVPRGYQKVAQFTIYNMEDYDKAFQLIDLYDLKKGNQKINRDIDIKYLTFEDVLVEDYENKNCIEKGTIFVCERVKVGEHYEEREVWVDFNKEALLKKGTITIGLFTHVQKGDYIDWVPTMYGEKITEWAAWSESLSSGLVFGYTFDHADDSGTKVVDVITGKGNLTSTTGTLSITTGKNGSAMDFDNGDSIYSTFDTTELGTGKVTVCYWTYYDSTPASDMWSVNTDNTDDMIFYFNDAGGTDYWQHSFGGGQRYSAENMAGTTWYHWCHRGNDTQGVGEIFIDGSDVGGSTAGTNDLNAITGNTVVTLGKASSGGIIGRLDEVYVWNRSLDDSEISDLAGGIQYVPPAGGGGDSTPPYFTNVTNLNLYSNTSLGWDLDATDETGFDCFTINDTTNYNINCSGWVSNKTSLSVGTHNLNITINDTTNNLNSTIWILTVSEPACSPDVQNTSWTSWIDMESCRTDDNKEQNRSRIEYDANECGAANVTHWDFQNTSCNYCSYSLANYTDVDWFNVTSCSGGTYTENSTITTYDLNNATCYAVTLIAADAYNSGANLTGNYQRQSSCGQVDLTLFEFDLSSRINIFMLFIGFVFIGILVYFGLAHFASFLLVIMGFLLMLNDFNTVMSFIVIAIGVVIAFKS